MSGIGPATTLQRVGLRVEAVRAVPCRVQALRKPVTSVQRLQLHGHCSHHTGRKFVYSSGVLKTACSVTLAATEESGISSGGKLKQWIASYGLGAFFAFITISNVMSCSMLAVGGVLFKQQFAASPFAAGQWPKFLAFYAGLWTIQQSTRPFRLAGGMMLSPIADQFIDSTSRHLNRSRQATTVFLFVAQAVFLLTALAAVLVLL